MVLVVLLLPLFRIGAEPTGSICVAPLHPKTKAIDHDYPAGKAPREYRYQFTVQVDSLQPVAVGAQSPILISAVPTGRSHRVVIRDAGRPIESFHFSFEKRGALRLCLSYAPWYQTWSLEPVRLNDRSCRCQ
jgi:hypothetical protein